VATERRASATDRQIEARERGLQFHHQSVAAKKWMVTPHALTHNRRRTAAVPQYYWQNWPWNFEITEEAKGA